MRTSIRYMLVAMLCAGCVDNADNCYNTATCPPGPDAGPTVVYVVSDAGVPCEGVCAPIPSAGENWSQPFVRWSGPTENLGKEVCPPAAPVPSDPWYSTPDQSPLSCLTCSCAPSTGTCAPPASISVSASPACPSDLDAGVPFDPPSAWDGGCTTNDAIASVDCDGGPCSATVATTAPTDECAPNQVMIPTIVTWAFVAVSCAGIAQGDCASPGEVCTPKPPSAPKGYSLCVSQPGDAEAGCPAHYPARSVFYFSADDTRHCADCECGPPQGSSCSSLVSLYSDSSCSDEVASVTATSLDSMCVDIPAGVSLGSKQAGPPTYTAGTCQPSGGGPIGSVQPKTPFTFCCEK
jgi:hypothetical protein